MIDITKGGKAIVNGGLVEYQAKGKEQVLCIGEQVRVRGGFAEIFEAGILCVSGEVKAERGSKVAMFGGRATVVDSEVRLPSGAEDCLIVAHGCSEVYLSMGIRMCEIIAGGETIVYVPGDPAVQPARGETVIVTRGLYSCNIDLQGDAQIKYLP